MLSCATKYYIMQVILSVNDALEFAEEIMAKLCQAVSSFRQLVAVPSRLLVIDDHGP